MSEHVFLDSGIFIALLNSRDNWHSRAASLFSLADRPRWSTSILVVSEAYSWFLHKDGEEAARTFRSMLEALKLRLFEADKHHHSQVLKMLDRLRGSKLTYVDASSLCFMERHKIKIVWGTDRHLGLTGAAVLPRD